MRDGDDTAQSGKYDQTFFLGLAAKGKDEWNKWRRDPANKRVCVTFAGVDFSVAPRDRIDFSRFEFGSFVDFSGCKWRGAIDLEALEAFAPGRAFFNLAAFGDGASFAGAAFGNFANFDCAAFGIAACFDRAVFGIAANFNRADFRAGAIFTGAVFSSHANFNGADFGCEADFAEAAFGNFARFDGTTFGDRADFDRTHFKGPVQYTGKPPADEKVINWQRNRFLRISFANARFDGEANFSGRSFEQSADFTGTRFYYPPDFDGGGNVARIDFTGAYVGFVSSGKLRWTEDSRVPVRLRALRKIAEETKNHDFERDLYIEERKAERGVYLRQLVEELKKAPIIKKPLVAVRLGGHCLWIVLMFFYWALANYGRSFGLPFGWFVASGFFFYWCYEKILAPFMPKACPLADKYEYAVGMFALGNAVPVIGPLTIDGDIKKLLYCPGGEGNCLPIWFQFLVVWQNLLSIILVFFIGLALRNYFKIK